MDNRQNGSLSYKKKLLMKTPDAEVWLVHGKKVRDKHIEFVEGGHDLVYDWMPKKEIWVDDALHENEYTPVIIHELYERELMKKGVSYSKAHKRANLVELRGRRKPSTQTKSLIKHVAKNYFCNKCKEWHGWKDKLYERHIKYNHNN